MDTSFRLPPNSSSPPSTTLISSVSKNEYSLLPDSRRKHLHKVRKTPLLPVQARLMHMKHFDSWPYSPCFSEKKLYCFDTILPLFFYFIIWETKTVPLFQIFHYHLKISSYEDIKEEWKGRLFSQSEKKPFHFEKTSLSFPLSLRVQGGGHVKIRCRSLLPGKCGHIPVIR